MHLEEEHERLHRRGELIKFSVLVVALLLTVLTVAAARPLIFDSILPTVLGWNQSPAAPQILPSPTEPAITPTPQATQTVAPAVEDEPPVAGTVEAEASATPATYQVQRGDTLAAIAARFGVSVEALVQTNSIANPDRIQPGDVLLIPLP